MPQKYDVSSCLTYKKIDTIHACRCVRISLLLASLGSFPDHTQRHQNLPFAFYPVQTRTNSATHLLDSYLWTPHYLLLCACMTHTNKLSASAWVCPNVGTTA